jgi:CRISPR-associated exonuclease Cas4
MVQLCAQGICLEEMFDTSFHEGDLYYGRTHRRQNVPFDAALREHVAELAAGMHELFSLGKTPPGEWRTACKSCSLVEICLPKVPARRSVHKYLEAAMRDKPDLT